MFAVTVIFTIEEGRMQDFLPLMVENAARSRSEEPGCRQFDVWTDSMRPDEVFLFERYDDSSAFEQHLLSAHFRFFERAVSGMVSAKEVRCYAQVHQ